MAIFSAVFLVNATDVDSLIWDGRFSNVLFFFFFAALSKEVTLIGHFRVPKTLTFKTRFICMRMKNDFHIKGWAPTIALKQRPKGTQKWPILNLKSKAWPFKYKREGILFSGTIYTVCYVRKRTYFSPTVSWVVLIFPVVMIVVLKYSTMIHNKGYGLSANTV